MPQWWLSYGVDGILPGNPFEDSSDAVSAIHLTADGVLLYGSFTGSFALDSDGTRTLSLYLTSTQTAPGRPFFTNASAKSNITITLNSTQRLVPPLNESR